MHDEFYSPPHRLLGVAFYTNEFPCFAVPVFRNLENDALYTQIVDHDNIIAGFSQIDFTLDWNYPSDDFLVRKGSRAVVALARSATEIKIIDDDQTEEEVKSVLQSGELEQSPFFARELAKIVDNKALLKDINIKLYNETLRHYPKSQRFFLENSIVREFMISNSNEVDREAFQYARIEIRDNKVFIGTEVKTNTDDSFYQQLTNEIKTVTKSDELSIDFHIGSELKFNVVDEAAELNFLYLQYSNGVLDCGHFVKYPSYKEAFCIIPQAANEVVKRAMTRNDRMVDLQSEMTRNPKISPMTFSKIVSLTPVSLRSAQIFRVWQLHTRERVERERNFILHLAIFIAAPKKSEELKALLQNNQVLQDTIFQRREVAFTFSMILLFVEKGFIRHEDVSVLFAYSRKGFFAKSNFRYPFLIEWLEYAENDFKMLTVKEINRRIDSTIKNVERLEL